MCTAPADFGCGLCRRLAAGYRRAPFDDAVGDGVTGETRRVVKVELLHQVVPVLLDRLDADAQLRRDLFVGFALSNQLENLQLARTQAGESFPGGALRARRLFLRVRSRLEMEGLKNVPPSLDLPDGVSQIGQGALLQQVSRRAGRGHLLDIGVIAVGREDEHPGGGNGFENLPRGLDPIEDRHGDVHDDDRRTKLPRQFDCFPAGPRLGDNLEVSLGLPIAPGDPGAQWCGPRPAGW